MPDLIANAISALMCMVVGITLAPLAKTIHDQGAPWGLSAVFYGIALVSLAGMLFFLWQIAQSQIRGKGRRRRITKG